MVGLYVSSTQPTAFEQGLVVSFAQPNAFEEQGVLKKDFGWINQLNPNTRYFLGDS